MPTDNPKGRPGHANVGSPSADDLGPTTIYTEEWVIVDGPKFSYKKVEYWGD
jgi:hypothetical protein